MKGLDTYGAQCQTVWGEKSSKKCSMCLAQFGGPGDEDRERRGAKKMIMCLDRRSRENELERKTRRETGDQCSPELAWRSGMATGWAFGVAFGACEAAKIDEDMGGGREKRKEGAMSVRATNDAISGWLDAGSHFFLLLFPPCFLPFSLTVWLAFISCIDSYTVYCVLSSPWSFFQPA